MRVGFGRNVSQPFGKGSLETCSTDSPFREALFRSIGVERFAILPRRRRDLTWQLEKQISLRFGMKRAFLPGNTLGIL
jgi:hypothetical protein